MGLLTFLMYHYCTSLALITVQDMHILSHSYNLMQTHTNYFYFSFFSHTVAIWNSLPYSIVSSPNISMFKKSYIIFIIWVHVHYTILVFAILCIQCTRCIKFHRRKPQQIVVKLLLPCSNEPWCHKILGPR